MIGQHQVSGIPTASSNGAGRGEDGMLEEMGGIPCPIAQGEARSGTRRNLTQRLLPSSLSQNSRPRTRYQSQNQSLVLKVDHVGQGDSEDEAVIVRSRMVPSYGTAASPTVCPSPTVKQHCTRFSYARLAMMTDPWGDTASAESQSCSRRTGGPGCGSKGVRMSRWSEGGAHSPATIQAWLGTDGRWPV